MACEINKCVYCNYNSNRKYNISRHMMTKHKGEEVNKITNESLNIAHDGLNVTNDDLNVANDNKCNKILSSKRNLNNHLIKCKVVLNSLECHICHKILSNSISKSRHIKICKERNINNNELIEINTNNNELIEIDNNKERNELQILNINNNSNNIII